MGFNFEEFEKALYRRQQGFRRAAGGFAWPYADRPGALVIVTEDHEADRAFRYGEYHLRVREEYEDVSLNRLFERAIAMGGRWLLDPADWVGNSGNPMRAHLEKWNQSRSAVEPTLHIGGASYFDDKGALDLYHQTVKDLLRSDNKLLHFPEESNLPSALLQLTTEELTKKPDEFPLVAALCYAVVTCASDPTGSRKSSRRKNRGRL